MVLEELKLPVARQMGQLKNKIATVTEIGQKLI